MKAQKNLLRKEKRNARKGITPEMRALFSKQISEKIITSEYYKKARTILLYRALPEEVNLSEFASIAHGHGKKLFYPCCISKTEMIALHPRDNIWTTGSFGILEPDSSFSDTLPPSELDLIICPCVAFDEQCNRLGMGAGYYDRFLEKCTDTHIIAVAFEVQKASLIPVNAYDQKMEHIFTENNIYSK